MAKNKFGVKQIKAQTPMWATWVFRVVFLLVSIAIFVIASDPGIHDAIKVRIGVYLKAFEMLIYGLSKMVGVSVDAEQGKPEQQDETSESHV